MISGNAEQDGASERPLRAKLNCQEAHYYIDSADTDDSSVLGTIVVAYLQNYLFLGGSAPESPYPECGPDPTIDDLTCESFPACKEP